MLRYMFFGLIKSYFSFQTFVIASPYTFQTTDTNAAAPAQNFKLFGDSFGDCATDAFQITSPGQGQATPIICGTNTGYHSK